MKTISTLMLVVACFTATLAQKKEERSVSDFKSVNLSTAGKVYVTQGNGYKVVLEGSNDVLKEVETEVRGSKLVIKKEGSGWFNWSSDDDLTVYITMPSIEGLSVSSSGKIYGQNKFKTDDLRVSVSGSGKVQIQTSSDNVDISISGSGKVKLEGEANSVEASVSGSGDVMASDFKAKDYSVSISGSGSCEVYAEESIDARISGSGSVHYKGNPKKVNSKTAGSGSVRKI
ncbi:head GIN domain-containing protein [Fulvivirga ligni]|uniref:head GIN domain-containing protein n=1 Tax=Fulvivirga ligni TaxID=2904246 RepID=UPI001F46EEE0|nr:head GIN domain-containing protein [Fulvivirga ligni]UII23060.1 DUF2807 domain-containing protein [Fulvivirga ligni]